MILLRWHFSYFIVHTECKSSRNLNGGNFTSQRQIKTSRFMQFVAIWLCLHAKVFNVACSRFAHSNQVGVFLAKELK